MFVVFSNLEWAIDLHTFLLRSGKSLHWLTEFWPDVVWRELNDGDVMLANNCHTGIGIHPIIRAPPFSFFSVFSFFKTLSHPFRRFFRIVSIDGKLCGVGTMCVCKLFWWLLTSQSNTYSHVKFCFNWCYKGQTMEKLKKEGRSQSETRYKFYAKVS